jgi:hypothetical protein
MPSVRLVCWSAVSTPWRALDKEAVTSFWRPEPRSSLPPISRGAESSDLHGGIQQRLVSPVARHAYHRGGVPSESTQVKSQLADRVQALGGAISSRVPPGKPPPRQSRSRSVADSQSVRTFWDLAAAHQEKPLPAGIERWAPAATTFAASFTIVEWYEASLGLPHEQTTFWASPSRDCRPESWGAHCPTRASIARGAPRGR